MDDKHAHHEHEPTYEGGGGAPTSGTGAVGGGTNAPTEPPGEGAPSKGTGAVGGGTNNPSDAVEGDER